MRTISCVSHTFLAGLAFCGSLSGGTVPQILHSESTVGVLAYTNSGLITFTTQTRVEQFPFPSFHAISRSQPFALCAGLTIVGYEPGATLVQKDGSRINLSPVHLRTDRADHISLTLGRSTAICRSIVVISAGVTNATVAVWRANGAMCHVEVKHMFIKKIGGTGEPAMEEPEMEMERLAS